MYEVSGVLTDTDHYLVFAKVRERLALSEQAAHKFDDDRWRARMNAIINLQVL
jgi:hypothetical protein